MARPYESKATRQGQPKVGDRPSPRSNPRPVHQRRRFGSWAAISCAILLAAPLTALVTRPIPVPPVYVAVYLFLISLVTYGVYAWDKRKAQAGLWRIPESTLHLLELAGGWPAAFVAQRLLRHKIVKVSYQVVFWLIVVAHQLVAVDRVHDGRMTAKLVQRVSNSLGSK